MSSVRVKGKAASLELPCAEARLAEAMLELYEVFSQQKFQAEIACHEAL